MPVKEGWTGRVFEDFAVGDIYEHPLGRTLLGPWTRIAREGLVSGLLGAAAVAVWFLLYDVAAGVPLRTPALLDAVLFHGLRDPSALVITMPRVAEYTALHVLAFVFFGWLAAALLALADREPRVLFAFIMLVTMVNWRFGSKAGDY